MDAVRKKMIDVDGLSAQRNAKQQNIRIGAGWIQNAVKNRRDKQPNDAVCQGDNGKQRNTNRHSNPIRPYVGQQPL
jgi:hypothetical protein